MNKRLSVMLILVLVVSGCALDRAFIDDNVVLRFVPEAELTTVVKDGKKYSVVRKSKSLNIAQPTLLKISDKNEALEKEIAQLKALNAAEVIVKNDQ